MMGFRGEVAGSMVCWCPMTFKSKHSSAKLQCSIVQFLQ